MNRAFCAWVITATVVTGCGNGASDAGNIQGATFSPAPTVPAHGTLLAPIAQNVSVARLSLTSPPDPAAVAAVRRGLADRTDTAITADQSFDVIDRGRRVATLVTGEGRMPEAVNAGCFVAIVQNGRPTMLPTIGAGAWEAETCLETAAVGIVATAGAIRFAIIYKAASPNAEVVEPVILRWDPAHSSLTIDEAASTRASTAGATSVTAVRALLRR